MALVKKYSDCVINTTHGLNQNLKDYLGQWVILYFYPKDMTSGCTIEGRDFNTYYSQFKELNAEVLGVSKDNLSSHEKFKQKESFQFHLIADETQTLCELFDVIQEKSMYGKKYFGIERSTFIINPKGELEHTWRKVKVKGHVEDVLETLKRIQQREGE